MALGDNSVTILYCKTLGEVSTDHVGDHYKCLVHGWQGLDHFSEEKNNIKYCEICNKEFFCEDEILKVCSLACASEYIASRDPNPIHKPINYDELKVLCPYCKDPMKYCGYTAFNCHNCHKGFSVRFTDLTRLKDE